MKNSLLVIADADRTHVARLTSHLKDHPSLKVVATEENGLDALSRIREFKPDLVLMDIMLQKLDGICLLKEIRGMKNPPTVVCTSAFFSLISIGIAHRNGAAYCLQKPVSPEIVETALLECAELREEHRQEECGGTINWENDVKREIYELLVSLGFSARYNGSRYLAEAVAYAIRKPSSLHNLSAGLYRELGQIVDASASQIERCVRIAIDAANANAPLSEKIGVAPTNKAVLQYLISRMSIHF